MTGRLKSKKTGNSLSVFLFSIFVSLISLVLSACQVTSPISQRPRSVVSKAPQVQAINRPSDNKPLLPAPRIVAPSPTPSTQSLKVCQPSPAATVAEQLKPAFSVNLLDARSLDVRRANRNPEFKPSLFEQSIILAKVRNCLNAAIRGYPRMTAEATLRNAIARVFFRGDIAPDAATQAISAILSIGGVDQVSATFPEPGFRQAAK